jgi:SAM-dependent methyltransferase
MSMLEDSYGVQKRFQFLKDVIEKYTPLWVLDIGCGTGTHVIFPLAEYFTSIKFLGVDSDVSTIQFAKARNSLQNLYFTNPEEIETHNDFDLIIASEVIEHVERPVEFLFFLRDKLSEEGKIVLTLPNGYGAFELMALLEACWRLSGFYKVFEKTKRLIITKTEARDIGVRDTLARSPHINFFSFSKIGSLIHAVGLNILDYRPRTFLCGFVFDRLLQGQRVLEWNTKVCEYFPPYLNSGWMFVLEKKEHANLKAKLEYRNSLYTKFKRHLNKKRWGLI